VILRGGYTNEGKVERVGETVRRPAKQDHEYTSALLLQLERGGFTGAPRYLDSGGSWTDRTTSFACGRARRDG
jgi:hypothetical protein